MKKLIVVVAVIFSGITIYLIHNFINSYVAKEIENSISYYIKDKSFYEFNCLRFRLHHPKADQNDINQCIEKLFYLWVSDPEQFGHMKNMKVSYNAEQNNLFINQLDKLDPLMIKRFGDIFLKSDNDYITFNVLNDNSSVCRLSIIPCKNVNLKTLYFNSYENLARNFTNEFKINYLK
mgnify:CR=1 FL=1